MSTFGKENYQWRETYFVLFDSAKRPSSEKMEKTLRGLNPRFELVNVTSDDSGLFDSLTLRSPQDFAALDISYVTGEEVLEQGASLAKEMKTAASDAGERKALSQLAEFDARFDILHFEQMSEAAAEDSLDEMLDPSALLVALDALIELTGGVGIDPQAGAML